MIMPMVVNAADRDDKQNRRNKDSYSSRKREEDRRDNDRRDNDRRSNDRQGNDRWSQNGGHDNGNHNGWDKNGKNSQVSYNSRHDDWHRSSRTSHRDDCRYDGGQWRQQDTRYRDSYGQNGRYNDPYYNDPYRNDPRYDDRNYRGGSYESDRRQDTKNEWRNLGIASGILGIIGLLNNDSTLTFAGAAGALYSAHRYEQDRKSQNRIDRGRAYYFSQPYFVREGQRYERRDVNRNGQRYYQFVRCN